MPQKESASSEVLYNLYYCSWLIGCWARSGREGGSAGPDQGSPAVYVGATALVSVSFTRSI